MTITQQRKENQTEPTRAPKLIGGVDHVHLTGDPLFVILRPARFWRRRPKAENLDHDEPFLAEQQHGERSTIYP